MGGARRNAGRAPQRAAQGGRALWLCINKHLKTFQNSGAQMQILLYAVSPTAEDPSQDFVEPTALATTTIALADAVPRLYRTAVPANAGAMLRLVLKPTMSGTVGTLSAELSITLSSKA